MSIANLRGLLNGNSFRIVIEIYKAEIRKRLHAPNRYIVYHETIQGQKDLGENMRRKTRAGGSSHWKTALGGKTSLNSNKLNIQSNSKIATSTSKPNWTSHKNKNNIK